MTTEQQYRSHFLAQLLGFRLMAVGEMEGDGDRDGDRDLMLVGFEGVPVRALLKLTRPASMPQRGLSDFRCRGNMI